MLLDPPPSLFAFSFSVSLVAGDGLYPVRNKIKNPNFDNRPSNNQKRYYSRLIYCFSAVPHSFLLLAYLWLLKNLGSVHLVEWWSSDVQCLDSVTINCVRVVKMTDLWFPSSDMLYEVLSKLFTKDLLNFKAVSKGWQCLISDRSFIKVQLKKMEPLAGFFYQSRDQPLDDVISYIPIATTEVQSGVLDFLPESVFILNSSYGLLCCRSSSLCSVPVIYILNPVNKDWKKLHWPNPSSESCITLAFDPFKNPIDAFTNFKVVIVGQNESNAEGDRYFSFNLYSSKTDQWRRSIDTRPCNQSILKKGSICVQGILYWLTDGNQILRFDPEKEKSWLIMGPLPTTHMKLKPEVCMGEVEGKLHFVLISDQGLQLWVLMDHTISQWDLTFTSTLEVLDREIRKNKYLSDFDIAKKLKCDHMISSPWWIETLSFKDNILLMRVGGDLYLHHFQTKKMRHVGRLDDIGQNGVLFAAVCPFTMSLVPLVDDTKK